MSSPVDAGLLHGGLRCRYQREARLCPCQEFLPLPSDAALAGRQSASFGIAWQARLERRRRRHAV